MIRVGIVGAGANTRLRHIPGFRELKDVEVAGVCNRSLQSSQKVAEEFDIPRTYESWEQVVNDENIDAVMIGTWPNMHCEVTCAALEAGKHVLTEARMAMNLEEARKMQATANANPNLITQIVPCPFGLEHNLLLDEIMGDDFIGQLRELVVIGVDDLFWDYTKELHWRQDVKKSGLNTLTLGMLQEVVNRFCPETTEVFAQASIFEGTRPLPDAPKNVDIQVPDSIQVVTKLANNARGMYHLSGINLFGPGQQIHMYGTEGTIKLEFGAQDKMWSGRIGDSELKCVEVEGDRKGRWRVEEEFINAIRGNEKVKLTDFDSGVKYMEFTEAVHKSSAENAPVGLPLG